MANGADINVNISVISENDLRRIIQEEIAKARVFNPVVQPIVRPGTPYYPYVPYYQEPRQWWQNPVIC